MERSLLAPRRALPDRTDEVAVDADALTASSKREDALDGVPGRGGDEWFVQPVLIRPVERYDALVVRVSEHFV